MLVCVPQPPNQDRKFRRLKQEIQTRLAFLGFPQARRESPERSKQPKIETLTQETHRARDRLMLDSGA